LKHSRRLGLLLAYLLVSLAAGGYLISLFPSEAGDFLIQMTAGRVAELDGPTAVYDWELQSRRQAEIRGIRHDPDLLLPFNHPPILLPALRPLSRLSLDRAFRVWTYASVAFLLLAIWIMLLPLRRSGASVTLRLLVAATVLCFFPLVVSVFQGQDTSLLLVAIAAWWVLLGRERDVSAGFALAAALIRPQIALGLAIPFLFNRRRVFLGFAAGATAFTVYSLSLVGPSGAAALLQLVRETSLEGRFAMGGQRMPNLAGILHRLAGEADRTDPSLIAWAAWLVFLIGASIRFGTLRRRAGSVEAGVLLVGAVFLAPHIHMHDLAILSVAATGSVAWRHGHGWNDWDVPLLGLALTSLLLLAAWIGTGWWYTLFLAAAATVATLPPLTDLRRAELQR